MFVILFGGVAAVMWVVNVVPSWAFKLREQKKGNNATHEGPAVLMHTNLTNQVLRWSEYAHQDE